MTMELQEREARRRFRAAYGLHRAAEGRGVGASELLALPYLTAGTFAQQWRVRARTFDVFVERILTPRQEAANRPLRVLDLGAGNGWLAFRVARMGHDAVAADIRTDAVDGLGAAPIFAEQAGRAFQRVAASFDELPFPPRTFDIAVFNASLHYATDLHDAVAAAARVVRPGGCMAVLDSPFYPQAEDGEAMVAEKRSHSTALFGTHANDLMALPFIEYLTLDRLAASSAHLHVDWRKHRVRYPLWYELRPLVHALRGRRTPSRFDAWEGTVQ